MILEGILTAFFGLLDFLLDFIPEFRIFEDESITSSAINEILGYVACFLPVNTIAIALGFWVVLANLDFLMQLIHWFIRKVPGLS